MESTKVVEMIEQTESKNSDVFSTDASERDFLEPLFQQCQQEGAMVDAIEQELMKARMAANKTIAAMYRFAMLAAKRRDLVGDYFPAASRRIVSREAATRHGIPDSVFPVSPEAADSREK